MRDLDDKLNLKYKMRIKYFEVKPENPHDCNGEGNSNTTLILMLQKFAVRTHVAMRE